MGVQQHNWCASKTFYQFAINCPCSYNNLRFYVTTHTIPLLRRWFIYASEICIEEWWNKVREPGFNINDLPSPHDNPIFNEDNNEDDLPNFNGSIYGCMSWWNRFIFYLITGCWMNNYSQTDEIHINEEMYNYYISFMRAYNESIPLINYYVYTTDGSTIDGQGFRTNISLNTRTATTETDNNDVVVRSKPYYVPIYVDDRLFITI